MKNTTNTRQSADQNAEIEKAGARANERLAYTPAEFAAMFGKSKTWTYRLLYAGKIRRIKGAPSVLIPHSELQLFVGQTIRHE